MQIKGRDDAGIETLLDQAKRGLPTFQSLPGKGQHFLIRRQGQVTLGDSGNQADLRHPLRFFGGKILFQRLILEVSYPAEEVKLVKTDANAGAVLPKDFRRAGPGKIGRLPLHAAARTGIELRQEGGALNLVKSAVFIDIKGGDLEIAIVLQSEFDRTLQAGIKKKFPPGDFGHHWPGRCSGLIGRSRRPTGRGRGFRTTVVRCQGAAGASQKNQDYRKKSCFFHFTIPPRSCQQQAHLLPVYTFFGQRLATP